MLLTHTVSSDGVCYTCSPFLVFLLQAVQAFEDDECVVAKGAAIKKSLFQMTQSRCLWLLFSHFHYTLCVIILYSRSVGRTTRENNFRVLQIIPTPLHSSHRPASRDMLHDVPKPENALPHTSLWAYLQPRGMWKSAAQ